MIHKTDILDAILSDGGKIVSIDFAPCEECNIYHIISHGNDEITCEKCSPKTARLAKSKEKESLKVDSDGTVHN